MNRRAFLSSSGLWLLGAPAIVRAITPQQRAVLFSQRPPQPVVSSAFTPTDISGLKAWWKADSLSLNNNDLVASWSTSGGSSRTATQDLDSLKPVFLTAQQNGLPLVYFDDVSVGKILTFTTESLQYFTCFVVFSQESAASAYAGPLNWRNSGEYGFQLVNDGNSLTDFVPHLVCWNGTTETANKKSTTIAFPVALNLTMWRSDFLYKHNTSSEATSDGSSSWASTYPGAIGFGYNSIKGKIGEILVYDTELSTQDVGKVESYANTRWALW